jgi:hypothetical protein
MLVHRSLRQAARPRDCRQPGHRDRGLQSIRSLSVRSIPGSDIAVVTVTTAYIGANADLVRGFITRRSSA